MKTNLLPNFVKSLLAASLLALALGTATAHANVGTLTPALTATDPGDIGNGEGF